jgi:hypothetical protein
MPLQRKLLAGILSKKAESDKNVRKAQIQALAHSLEADCEETTQVASDIIVLRTAMEINQQEKHPEVAAFLAAAITALESGQPMNPVAAVLPHGGSATTYSARMKGIFMRVPGVSEASCTDAQLSSSVYLPVSCGTLYNTPLSVSVVFPSASLSSLS